MTLPSFGKIAAAAAALTLTGLATTTSASAAWRPYYGPPVERVQYYGGGHYYGGPQYGGPGWGHHRRHWGPRCWVERVVRPTPWGREVVNRRVCR